MHCQRSTNKEQNETKRPILIMKYYPQHAKDTGDVETDS